MTDMRLAMVQVGDWVSGTSMDDERYRGYVEAISRDQGSAFIRVTESDRTDSVGRVVESLLGKLERLSGDSWKDDNALLDMIDLALATKDEPWFMELTSGLLQSNSQAVKSVKQAQSLHLPMHRRIWID